MLFSQRNASPDVLQFVRKRIRALQEDQSCIGFDQCFYSVDVTAIYKVMGNAKSGEITT